MRLAGYVRVSRVGGREGDSFISPALQREQIAALARARGHEIIEWIEDLDESGGKWDRPGFQQALGMVERREADGVAVAKLDRFARSLADALRAIERIDQAGGELISVADNFDTTTPMGRAMLQISLVFAELERERQRESFHVAKARAIGRGIHISTLVPAGYERGPDRRLVPVRRDARAIRDVFLRRAAGASWGELAELLDRRLPRPSTWTRNSVAKLIRNRAYLGEAHQGAIVNPDAHPAIVSRAEWEAAQSEPGFRPARSGSLLAGLLTCASCGGRMTRLNSHDYGCRARRSSGVCPAPLTIRVGRADAYVEQRYLEWAAGAPGGVVAPRTDEVAAAAGRLEAAETELTAYRDANLVSIIGRDVYIDGLASRARTVDETRRELGAAQRSVGVARHHDAVSLWPRLTVAEKRALIGAALLRAVVSRGTAQAPVSARLRLRFRGHDGAGIAGTEDA